MQLNPEASRLLNESVLNIALFVYVRGIQRGVRTVSDERACEEFAKDFGPFFGEPSTEALRKRYQRAKGMYFEDQRTKE